MRLVGPISAKCNAATERWRSVLPRQEPRWSPIDESQTTTGQPKPVSSQAAADWRGGRPSKPCRNFPCRRVGWMPGLGPGALVLLPHLACYDGPEGRWNPPIEMNHSCTRLRSAAAFEPN